MPLAAPKRLLPVALACLAVFALFLAVAGPGHALLGLSSGPTSLKPVDGVVAFPAADLADGKAHFYAVDAAGKEVRFFAVKTQDGRVRTALDACDVCYPEKKGYRQEGDFLICINCGRRFHKTMVGDQRGGCNPSPLASEVAGDVVRVKMADLAVGAAYF
ncbi:MAG: putative membrane protein [Solidesulfovibrio magneticus str. Maddingley MBC34]|uniref:Putative membrane protein n=1 Tax=Solidesulfovibrio magneticus str. Maddingley MBC34 TaxID=1206767 RepID=K6G9B9_9BACT|nr:MAG: putative membrane protein [Solidesulfovibrio magneticus str. Maddingley MBC34]